MKRKLALGALVILLFAAAGAALFSVRADAQGSDPALRHPIFAAAAREHGKDWEQYVHPKLRIVLEMQRVVGTHALIVGFSDEEPNAQYLEPKAWLFVTEWDGTDLYASGVPRTYNGKPLNIRFLKGFAEPLDDARR